MDVLAPLWLGPWRALLALIQFYLLHAPRAFAGGWEGAERAQICAELTGLSASVFVDPLGDASAVCEDRIHRKVVSIAAVLATVAAVAVAASTIYHLPNSVAALARCLWGVCFTARPPAATPATPAAAPSPAAPKRSQLDYRASAEKAAATRRRNELNGVCCCYCRRLRLPTTVPVVPSAATKALLYDQLVAGLLRLPYKDAAVDSLLALCTVPSSEAVPSVPAIAAFAAIPATASALVPSELS
jgi:hypothetical protein